jgi:hypothetical protein
MVDVLEPLMSEQTDLLVQRTQERAFGRGETVYALGDASEAVFLLLTGRIRLYGMVGGQELTFEVVRAGTMFGIASLMERTHDEYALALEPSQVGVLGLNDFWHLVRQNPQVNARLLKVLGDRLRMTRGRMADIALKETPARLASLILEGGRQCWAWCCSTFSTSSPRSLSPCSWGSSSRGTRHGRREPLMRRYCECSRQRKKSIVSSGVRGSGQIPTREKRWIRS